MNVPNSIKDALTAVEKYHDALSRAKFEQETQRDKTLVLIAGGALTVSFAFIPTLMGKPPVVRIGWLIGAWTCWVATLVFTIANYTLSIYGYQRILNASSQGDWGRVRAGHPASKVIESLNVLTAAIMVVGFGLFGYFAIGNLERATNAPTAHQQEESQQEAARTRQLRSAAPAGVPAPAQR